MTGQLSIDAETEPTATLFVYRIAAGYGMAQAILFGSHARRTHRPDSDMDMAIILRGEPQRLLPTKLALADLAFDVLLETGIRIQPFPLWKSEWQHPEDYSNPELLANIARDRGCL